MAKFRLLAGAGLVALAAAAPAGALTIGAPQSAAIHRGTVVAVTTNASRDQHSCQANRSGDRVSSTRTARKFAPVACEQPPRSSLVAPDQISKAVASALAAFG